jgi:hypothetical protein
MKQVKLFIMLLIISMSSTVSAQTINWKNLKKENKHMINANMGVEHGMIYGLGYAYPFSAHNFPMLANFEISIPSGNEITDDFKIKTGVQTRWVEFNHFQFSTKIQGIFRRYQNDFTRLVNFGSDLTGVFGYYRSKWFAGAEVGFDKAIVTHFKHSDVYKGQFPGVIDGWHEPASGGNFYFGIQGGFSFGKGDLSVRAGKMLQQDFKSEPLVPAYAQIGYTVKF